MHLVLLESCVRRMSPKDTLLTYNLRFHIQEDQALVPKPPPFNPKPFTPNTKPKKQAEAFILNISTSVYICNNELPEVGLLGIGEFGAVELVAHRRADETFAMKSSPSEQVSPTRGLQIAQNRYHYLYL